MKTKLFTLTTKDFEWQYFRGSGKGGQKRNKTSNACRCIHRPSGSMGVATELRSQRKNREAAFDRCTKTDRFQKWLKIEIAKRTADMAKIEKDVEAELRNVKVEIIKDGHWMEEKKNL